MNQFLRHMELNPREGFDPSRYPFSIPAVARLGRLVFDPAVTLLVGENGSGKSTLIEALAIKCGFNPEGGSKNFTSSSRPSESALHEHLRLARGTRRERSGFFLRAETMFNVATEAEREGYGAYGWTELHERSHGEGFLWVLLHKFGPRGLYLLDEPESALSPQRQLTFLTRLHDLVRQGAQFVISTHSPIILAYPNATIYQLDEAGIKAVSYRETEHYQVTADFLKNPDLLLRQLLMEPDDSEP